VQAQELPRMEKAKGAKMKIEEMSIQELVDKLLEFPNIHRTNLTAAKAEILRRFAEKDEQIRELEEIQKMDIEKANKILFEKFSEYFAVNEWTPESGFENQLDFYIHESWKREPVASNLKKQIADPQKQIEDLKYTVRLAYGWVKEYSNDSDNATHAKRVLNNEIISWQFDNLTQKERG